MICMIITYFPRFPFLYNYFFIYLYNNYIPYKRVYPSKVGGFGLSPPLKGDVTT